MLKKDEYKNHIKEAWKFAEETAKEISKGMMPQISIVLFEKLVSPYHYFIQNISGDKTELSGKPTEKMCNFAKDLGMKNPEQHTFDEVSDYIDEHKGGKK